MQRYAPEVRLSSIAFSVDFRYSTPTGGVLTAVAVVVGRPAPLVLVEAVAIGIEYMADIEDNQSISVRLCAFECRHQ